MTNISALHKHNGVKAFTWFHCFCVAPHNDLKRLLVCFRVFAQVAVFTPDLIRSYGTFFNYLLDNHAGSLLVMYVVPFLTSLKPNSFSSSVLVSHILMYYLWNGYVHRMIIFCCSYTPWSYLQIYLRLGDSCCRGTLQHQLVQVFGIHVVGCRKTSLRAAWPRQKLLAILPVWWGYCYGVAVIN